jgi:hypothetical protein
MFELVEISQGIKTFCFKSFIRKTISNFLLLLLEGLLWENEISKKNYLPTSFIETYARLLARNEFSNVL